MELIWPKCWLVPLKSNCYQPALISNGDHIRWYMRHTIRYTNLIVYHPKMVGQYINQQANRYIPLILYPFNWYVKPSHQCSSCTIRKWLVHVPISNMYRSFSTLLGSTSNHAHQCFTIRQKDKEGMVERKKLYSLNQDGIQT